MNLTIAALLIVALFATAQPATAKTAVQEVDRNTPYVPGEVILGFNSYDAKVVSAQATALAGTVNAQVVKQYGNMALLSFEADADVLALSTQLRSLSGVAFAEPNYISWIPEDGNYISTNRDAKLTEVTRVMADGTKFTVGVDELMGMRSKRGATFVPTYPNDAWNNWGWSWVGADIIWPNTTASPAVCVVDTGADIAHPDLAGKVTNGWDFVNNDAIPNDDNGHGTHVSGVIVAKNNNGLGLAGISNGGVLAVKVLSAQGWGTAFDIASGIVFCADKPLVKVISMSLGGGAPSSSEYSALQYAINTKGKLVVAAAGNSSMGWNMLGNVAPSFPAGWASANICIDGSWTSGTCNNIYQGLLAVGAAGSPFYSTQLWVDKNGNNVNDAGENFWHEQCAAWFSNFGNWVQIVAPGEDIWSTTPVSYPFWAAYYGNAYVGYDSWNGTSMATPHVSGGAARVWSFNPASANWQIKNLLISSGDSLTLASDSSIPTIDSLAAGYYGTYHGDAPYCWPNGNYAGGNASFYSMANSRYLNVARAMNRGGITAWVSEATTGLSLPGSTVQAFFGTALKDTSTTTKWSNWTDLINLPGSASYGLKVNKAGYTSGAQLFGTTFVNSGYYNANVTTQVSLGVSTRIQGVVDWWNWGGDLDVYVFLPKPPFSLGGVVGSGFFGPIYGRLDDRGPGLLADFPRARWNRDGGYGDWGGMESISIMPKTGAPTFPFYATDVTSAYDFGVTDYGSGMLNTPIVFRYWVGGVIKGIVIKTDTCDTNGADNILGNADDEIFWEPGYVGYGWGSVFKSWDVCSFYGNSSVIPYAVDGSGLSTTNKQP
jgi:subtilisin family serine protease